MASCSEANLLAASTWLEVLHAPLIRGRQLHSHLVGAFSIPFFREIYVSSELWLPHFRSIREVSKSC